MDVTLAVAGASASVSTDTASVTHPVAAVADTASSALSGVTTVVVPVSLAASAIVSAAQSSVASVNVNVSGTADSALAGVTTWTMTVERWLSGASDSNSSLSGTVFSIMSDFNVALAASAPVSATKPALTSVSVASPYTPVLEETVILTGPVIMLPVPRLPRTKGNFWKKW